MIDCYLLRSANILCWFCYTLLRPGDSLHISLPGLSNLKLTFIIGGWRFLNWWLLQTICFLQPPYLFFHTKSWVDASADRLQATTNRLAGSANWVNAITGPDMASANREKPFANRFWVITDQFLTWSVCFSSKANLFGLKANRFDVPWCLLFHPTCRSCH